MSRECPIIFNTEMVRAILDGRKVMTRRPLKPQPEDGTDCPYHIGYGKHRKARKLPYKVGNVLYVRETWQQVCPDWEGVSERKTMPCLHNRAHVITFKADYPDDWDATWQPSIHMPKWAARLHLLVTEVRCERIQDITSSDVRNEGITFFCGCPQPHLDEDYSAEVERYAQETFSFIWDPIYSKQGLGWEANPWVWVYRFEVQK